MASDPHLLIARILDDDDVNVKELAQDSGRATSSIYRHGNADDSFYTLLWAFLPALKKQHPAYARLMREDMLARITEIFGDDEDRPLVALARNAARLSGVAYDDVLNLELSQAERREAALRALSAMRAVVNALNGDAGGVTPEERSFLTGKEIH